MRPILLLLLLIPGLSWSAPDSYRCTVNGQKVFQKHPCRTEKAKPRPKAAVPAQRDPAHPDPEHLERSPEWRACVGRGLDTVSDAPVPLTESQVKQMQLFIAYSCGLNTNNFR